MVSGRGLGAGLPPVASTTPWIWVRRAAATGLFLIVIGWMVGLTGAWITPRFGWLVGAIGLFLIGGGWAVSRIGGLGVAAALIGCVAAGGMAVESHHFRVSTTARVVDLPSLADWDPNGDIIAAHVPELRLLPEQQARVRVRSGSGRTATTNIQVVVPLLDSGSGEVVGFHCRGESGPEPRSGGWVLSTAAWSGGGPVNCAAAVERSVQACERAGIGIAAGAESRFVEVFPDQAGLRTAYDLRTAVGIPLFLLFFYLVVVVVMREKGARKTG